ncbi:MAG: alkaline phosphatase family protein [Phycisphaerae bacterium]|nr:alkaline phosphatase family protein [Phycisphaerae bacterium]
MVGFVKARVITLLVMVAFLVPVGAVAQGAHLVAGPMVGSLTAHSARLWFEINHSDRVKVRCFDANTGQLQSAYGFTVVGPPPFVADLNLANLRSDHDYRIKVDLGGVPVRLPSPPLVIHTAPARGSGGAITLAFGSCANTAEYGSPQIWKSIAATQPLAFLFVGNAFYLPRHLKEFPYTYVHAERFLIKHYLKARRFAGFQRLLRIAAVYATWDDHDFGTPHSNRTFVFSQQSLQAFETYWPNPGYGIAHAPGTFCHFRLGDVAVFLLDDRTFRDPTKAPHPRTMLGWRQLAWLKRRLLRSRATFKLIVDGDPVLSDYPGHESWGNFHHERAAFFDWLFGHDVTGVVFLSGHRRFGELSVRPANTQGLDQYPLYDLTSSSLAARPVRRAKASVWMNPRRAGLPIFEHNFGLIRVGGPLGNRHIILELKNSRGATLLSQTILARQLTGG